MKINALVLERLGFKIDVVRDEFAFLKIVIHFLDYGIYSTAFSLAHLKSYKGIDGVGDKHEVEIAKEQVIIQTFPNILGLKDTIHMSTGKEPDKIIRFGRVYPIEKTREFLENTKYADVKII